MTPFNMETAPKGFIRTEETIGKFGNGRSVNMKVYHALFLRERKVCSSQHEAQEWIDGRKAAWIDTAGNENAVKVARITVGVAAKRVSEAFLHAKDALSVEQQESMKYAWDVLVSLGDSLK